MNNRFKLVRNTLGMTQEEMGTYLGLRKGTISDIERGKIKLTGRNMSILHDKLNVNIDYLKAGKGEMFITGLPEDNFTDMLAKFAEDTKTKDFLKVYLELDENGKAVIADLVHSLSRHYNT